MPLLFVNVGNLSFASRRLPYLSQKKREHGGSGITCSVSTSRHFTSDMFSLDRNHVTGVRSSKLLTLSDLVVLGPSQENPHAAEANRITQHICKKYQVYRPTFDKYHTITAFTYPRTSKDRLVTLNLLFCLLYFIDDEFECLPPREYANDQEGFGRLLETVVHVLCDGYEPKSEHALYALCREINMGLTQLCNPQTMKRLRDSCREHLRGFLSMRNIQTSDHISVDKYITLRLLDSGMAPAIDAIEIAWDVNVPDEVLQHEHIQEMMHCTKRIGWLGNDVFSYEKEVLDKGVRINLVNLLMEHYDLSLQEAVHEAISIVNSDSMRFVELEKNLPVWEDEEVNRIARCYVQGLKDVNIAVYHWQMSTNRYRSPRSPYPELRQLL